MPADLAHSGPPDGLWITTADELRYWAEAFDISIEQLKAVIDMVGNSLVAVEQEVGGR